MGPLDFASFPLSANLAIFAVAAAGILFAGRHLSRYADEISERTTVSATFVGILLLGGITSLPEIATTVTASAIGNAPLAVNNLFGGVALQVAVLAAADACAGRRALTSFGATPVVLLQGAVGILLLVISTAGMVMGDVAVFGIGLWTTAIFLAFLWGLYMVKQYEDDPSWTPIGEEEEEGDGESEGLEEKPGAEEEAGGAGRQREHLHHMSGRRLAMQTALAAVAILMFGYAATRLGDVLATQTGLGSSFVGAILVAIGTSLPEVSTSIEAVRLGAYKLAFSNVFGANLFDIGLLFVADVVYRQGPVLDQMGTFSQVAALLAIALTLIYIVGIVFRRETTILRLGLDSLLVIVLYLGGAYALFTLR